MLFQRTRQISGVYSSRHFLVIAAGLGLLLGVASLWFSPLAVLIALAAGGFLLAMLKRPEIGLLGLLTITSSIVDEASLPRIPIGIGTVYIPDLLLLGSLGLIVIRRLVEPDFKITRTPLDFPLLAFYGIAMLSTASAILQSSLTLNESLGEVRRVNNYLTFFIVTNLVREDRQLRWLWRGMALLAGVVAAVMIAQYLLGTSVRILPGNVDSLSTEGVRYSGVTRIIPPGESLVLVTFITMVVILALDKFRPVHVWRLVLCGLAGLGVILTFKRNLWVGVGLAFLLLAYLSRRQDRQKLIGWGLVAALGVAITLLLITVASGSEAAGLMKGSSDRLVSLIAPETFEDPKSSLRARDFEYAYALPQIASHPLLGLGLGAKYRPFVPGKDERFDARGYIHNGHIWVILKSGLLGYLCLAWASLAFLLRGFKYWRLVSDHQLRGIVLGFILTYIVILIGSLVSAMIAKTNWIPLIGIMMGMNEVILKQTFRERQGGDR